MSKIDDISKKVNTMKDNAQKALFYLTAKFREEIKVNINLRKQLQVQVSEKAKTLEGMDRYLHPKEYAELAAEVRNLWYKIQLKEETIAQYQLNLIEMGAAEKSDFE